MKKYQAFRSFGNVDRNINKHVLVAVEYGEKNDIIEYGVTEENAAE